MIRDRGRFGTFYGLATCLAVPYPSGGGEVFSLFRVAMPLRATRASPLGGFGAVSVGRGFFFGRRQ
jgi:hypothetical protein